MAEQLKPALRILRKKQVLDRLSISSAGLYDRLNRNSPRYDRTFPKQIRIGPGAVGWVESEIDNWIKAQINARDCEVRS